MEEKENQSRYEVFFEDAFHVDYKDTPGTSNKGYHIHRQFELLLCLSDGMFLDMGDGKRTDISAHTLLLFNNTDLHFFGTKEPGAENHRYVVYFDPHYVETLSTANVNLLECFLFRPFENGHILKLTPEDSETLQKRIDEMIRVKCHSERESYGREYHLQLMAAELLLCVNTLYHEMHQISNTPKMKNRRTVYSIIEYLYAHYAEDISLDFLAKHYYVNKYSLCEMFRDVVGITPNQYLINCRIMKAKQLLIAGESVDVTCGKAGFGNLSHFSRIFKQKVGQSPKQYQKAMAQSKAGR